jgi:hypothetical protein
MPPVGLKQGMHRQLPILEVFEESRESFPIMQKLNGPELESMLVKIDISKSFRKVLTVNGRLAKRIMSIS